MPPQSRLKRKSNDLYASLISSGSYSIRKWYPAARAEYRKLTPCRAYPPRRIFIIACTSICESRPTAPRGRLIQDRFVTESDPLSLGKRQADARALLLLGF